MFLNDISFNDNSLRKFLRILFESSQVLLLKSSLDKFSCFCLWYNRTSRNTETITDSDLNISQGLTPTDLILVYLNTCVKPCLDIYSGSYQSWGERAAFKLRLQDALGRVLRKIVTARLILVRFLPMKDSLMNMELHKVIKLIKYDKILRVSTIFF